MVRLHGERESKRFNSRLTVVRWIVRRPKTLQIWWQVGMMQSRMMIQNRWHRKRISGVAGQSVVLAWWWMVVEPHSRRVWVIVWRNGIVVRITVRAGCCGQLHEGGLARSWRIKVFGLKAEVHLVALSLERLNYKCSAFANVTKLTSRWWEPRYETQTSTWVALRQTTKLGSHAWCG